MSYYPQEGQHNMQWHPWSLYITNRVPSVISVTQGKSNTRVAKVYFVICNLSRAKAQVQNALLCHNSKIFKCIWLLLVYWSEIYHYVRSLKSPCRNQAKSGSASTVTQPSFLTLFYLVKRHCRNSVLERRYLGTMGKQREDFKIGLMLIHCPLNRFEVRRLQEL